MPLSGLSFQQVIAALGFTPVNPTALGTAAAKNTGTTAGSVVLLDSSAKLPAVDGSQLTNLPSSGGVAATPYTVTGAVTVGQLLAQRSDGTLEPVAGASYTAGAGAATNLDTTPSGPPSIFFDAPSGKYLAFAANASSGLTVWVGTVASPNSTTISWAAGVSYNSALLVSNTGVAISVNYDSVNSRYFVGGSRGSLVIVKFDGTTLTFGSIAISGYTGSAFGVMSAVWDADKATGVILCTANNYLYAVTFSGTGLTVTLTASTQISYLGYTATFIVSLYDPVNKVVVYVFYSTSGAQKGIISLPTTTSFTWVYHATISFNNTQYTSQPIGLVWLANISQVLVYSPIDQTWTVWDASSGSLGNGLYAPSGISMSTGYIVACYDATRSNIVLAYPNTSGYLTTCLVTSSASPTKVSGSDIVVASSSSYTPASMASAPATLAGLAAIVTQSTATFLVQPSSSTITNAQNYIGVAAASAASGGTTTLAPLNSKVSGFTGLTPMIDFCVSATGGLTTATTYPKVGKALSATSVVITGLAA